MKRVFEVDERYLMQLRQRCDEAGAVRRFIQVLRLHSEFPATAIERALQRALALACFSVDGVRHTCLKSVNVDLMKTRMMGRRRGWGMVMFVFSYVAVSCRGRSLTVADDTVHMQ